MQNFYIMKLMLVLVAMMISLLSIKAQQVFSVDYASQADVTVFVVKNESLADLKVYKVSYESQIGNNDGKWFFTQYASQAKKKIFFVPYESQADLKIYFVSNASQAGWRSSSKKHLMY